MFTFLQNRVFQRDHRDRRAIQPDTTYASHVSWNNSISKLKGLMDKQTQTTQHKI